jgi:hypothetical protein
LLQLLEEFTLLSLGEEFKKQKQEYQSQVVMEMETAVY